MEEGNLKDDIRQQSKTRVKVALRVRPSIKQKYLQNLQLSRGQQQKQCAQVSDEKTLLIGLNMQRSIPKIYPKQYKYDYVFGQHSAQEQIYNKCIKDLVIGCFQGYNAAVLAYGQTGSGKTYTMGTSAPNKFGQEVDNNQIGIIPRVINNIFQIVEEKKQTEKIAISLNFIQIYNQQIKDLLAPNQNKNLDIRIVEDPFTKLIKIEDVERTYPQSAEEMIKMLERGGRMRSTQKTDMNSASSRSHAIFIIYIQRMPATINSRFYFADLAGSQRASKTGATGKQFKEGVNINQSLLHLGNVISTLSQIDKKKQQYIGYRNSKLTYLLKDVLGGNSNTYMIACMGPEAQFYSQSINTLNYAFKAMNIKTTPIINRDKDDMLKQQNMDLRAEVIKLKQLLTEKGIKVQDSKIQVNTDQQQLRRLKQANSALSKMQRQTQQKYIVAKRQLNQLQIRVGTAQQQSSIMKLQFEQLQRQHPQLKQKFMGRKNQKMGILQKYMQQVQNLQSRLSMKSKTLAELQAEYNSLLQKSRKDEQILLNTNALLYKLTKQNNQLKKQIQRLSNRQENDYNQQQIPEQLQNIIIQNSEFVQQDTVIQQKHNEHNQIQEQLKQEMKQVNKNIEEKQQILKKISNDQMELQDQIIKYLKQGVHLKIAQIQHEKQKQLNQNWSQEKGKLNAKIQILDKQLRQYKIKAKQQTQKQMAVEKQRNLKKKMQQQIQKQKQQRQRIEKKQKKQKKQFQDFKKIRIKQLFEAKKKNILNDKKIRNLQIKNFKQTQDRKKKQLEIDKNKRVIQALKTFIKPSPHSKRPAKDNNKTVRQQKIDNNNHQSVVQVQYQQSKEIDRQQHIFVQNALEKIKRQIIRERKIVQCQNVLSQLKTEHLQFLKEYSKTSIELQRLKLNSELGQKQEDMIKRQELQIIMSDYNYRLQNISMMHEKCKNQYTELLAQSSQYFDIDVEVTYNKHYENLNILKSLIKALFTASRQTIQTSTALQNQYQKIRIQLGHIYKQKSELQKQLEMSYNIRKQYQRQLAQARQDALMLTRTQGLETQQVLPSVLKRWEQGQKKGFQRKLQQLGKQNRRLVDQLQKTRRRCEVLQQKYHNLKGLVSKDKSIGLKEEQHSKLQRKNTNTQMLQEIQGMINLQDKFKKTRSYTSFEIANVNQNDAIIQNENGSKWECIGQIEAHSSAVLSLAIHYNFAYSTAMNSINIWQLQKKMNVGRIKAQGSVKYVMVDPIRNILFTCCDKSISLWDINNLQSIMVLKAHKDQVKVTYGLGDYLLSGGKGTEKGGSLLVWDLRKLNCKNAMEEHEKNQDIFAMTSFQKTLYYGTRNHSVRRMKLKNQQILLNLQSLSPLEPPHLDSVSGLTIAGGKIISGSKDKHLKLWSVDNAVNSCKHTFYAFNDYVTALQNTTLPSIFYAGSKDGQLKCCNVVNDKIEVIGGFNAHSQSVNSICRIQQTPYGFATASQDKYIKIWQPTKDTIQNYIK